MKKRLLSVLATAAMLLSCLPVMQVSAETVTEGYLTFDKETGTIIGCDQNASGELVIPGEIDGVMVTSIGDGALSGCKKITNVIIPDSINSIGYEVFRGCNDLVDITVNALNSDYSSEAGVLFNKSKTTLICYPTNKYGDYIVPDSVTNIVHSAFYCCRGLTNIKLSDNLISIGLRAFYHCDNLTNVAIPESVTDMDDQAFRACENLLTITVDPLNNHYSTDDGVLFDKNKTELMRCPGGKTGEYVIPDGVIKIDSTAFDQCKNLTAIKFPESLVNIDGSAFSGCASLENIVVDPLNRKYNSNNGVLFSDNYTTLKLCPPNKKGEFIIPDGTVNIGDSAFDRCTNLTNIIIPDSVTSIEPWAFSHCSGISKITIPKNVASIGHYAFIGCNNLEDIFVDPYNSSFTSDDGVLFNKDKTVLLWCLKGKSGEYKVPDSVKSIDMGAFHDCKKLTSVLLGNSLTTIGDQAFSGCNSLTEIIIPNSIKEIGYEAFYGCNNITDIYYSGSEETWNSIFIDTGNTGLLMARLHYNYVKPEPEFSIEPVMDNVSIEKTVENGVLTLTVSPDAGSVDLSDIRMFVTQYNENDDISDVTEGTKEVSEGGKVKVSAELPSSDCKIFLWDSKQRPLMKAIEIR